MMSHKSVEKFVVRRLTIDLVCAFAASLCAGTFTFLIHLLKPREFNTLTYIQFMLMASVAYFAVALILHKFWKEGLRRMLPTWILISVFGSILFVIIRLLPAVIGGWSGPTVTEPSLTKYIATEVGAARNVMIFLSLITLPITALIYYAALILKAVKRWHNGAESPPGILIISSSKK